jgi:hypothetical protein
VVYRSRTHVDGRFQPDPRTHAALRPRSLRGLRNRATSLSYTKPHHCRTPIAMAQHKSFLPITLSSSAMPEAYASSSSRLIAYWMEQAQIGDARPIARNERQSAKKCACEVLLVCNRLREAPTDQSDFMRRTLVLTGCTANLRDRTKAPDPRRKLPQFARRFVHWALVFAFKVDGEEDLWIRSAELANMKNIIDCLIAEVTPHPVCVPCVPLGVVDLSMRDLVDAVYEHPFKDAPYNLLGGRHCQVCSAAFAWQPRFLSRAYSPGVECCFRKSFLTCGSSCTKVAATCCCIRPSRILDIPLQWESPPKVRRRRSRLDVALVPCNTRYVHQLSDVVIRACMAYVSFHTRSRRGGNGRDSGSDPC